MRQLYPRHAGCMRNHAGLTVQHCPCCHIDPVPMPRVLMQGQREIKIGDVLWVLKGSDRRYGVIRSCSWAPGHSGSSSSNFASASWHVQRALDRLWLPGATGRNDYPLHGELPTV